MIRIYKDKYFDMDYKELIEGESLQKFDFTEDNLVRGFMYKYFNGKCSYCEVTMEVLPLDIDFYRPIKGSLNTVDGEFYPDHYWWLKYQDDNIFSICVECKRAKSNRFPVQGRLAPINADARELLSEKRLLIHPSRDYPERHFVYDEDGMMYHRSKKGQVTIDVLNLNRSTLVEIRSKEYYMFNELCSLFARTRENHFLERILKELKSDSMFAGLKRFILFNWVIKNREIPYIKEFNRFIDNTVSKNHLKSMLEEWNEKDYLDNKKKSYFNKEKSNNYFDVTNERDVNKYYVKQRFIEKIEIHNFKGIKDLKMDFRKSKSSNAPWLMLLGENGVGKSSILQAIALTLMGEEQREKIIKKKPSEYLRNGTYEGFVKIHLSGMSEPICLFLDEKLNYFSGQNHIQPRVLILGYGSTRLLPREDMNTDLKITWARTENLFNPFIPLVNVRDYLLYLEDDFLVVKKAIESLFLETVTIERDRVNEEMYFNFPGSSIKLEDLSDGYQTIIALAVDIMMVMKNRWRNFDAEGIVLVDEIDAHLHPRWNIEIVRRLKKAFPKVQFISTTHNPLSLRGLIDGEVAVLLEDEEKEVYINQNLPAQEGFNIEGLLTSRFFGLYDTMPELNKIFDRYYLLLSNPSPSEEQKEEIKRLQGKLSKYEKVGKTLREQKFYEAVDYYFAYSRKRNVDLSDEEFSATIKEAIEYLER
ncbi:chromosome segregation protein SMC [Bacillus toyonensis]|uniref:AAA family ATPase n=1 Tax=Bacillus toyonensis TaxID=155322 RepID=UPI000BF494B4|nr:AAA family ATPase [Bacillus toyonensis]PEP90537.1 chromosome segregation protein SMC [Bacillus toyonensis]PHC31196.1 chromosome segregation protein SMC [Bacillus toyonensis]